MQRSVSTWLAFAASLIGSAMATRADDANPPPQARWLVRVDPVDLGARMRDELPAEVALDVGQDQSLDPTTFRIVAVDESGKSLSGDERSAESLPFRWYDESIPYQFPEINAYASQSPEAFKPDLLERGGYYMNAFGDGRRGRLAWMHTQVGKQPMWYAVECRLLKPGESPPHLPPQGWIGDGQARCAEAATQTVHSDHLRVDLDDWNGDGLVDLIVGDDFGHITWWPNLGTRQQPTFKFCRLIFDSAGQPIDAGSAAAPKLCDWDADGDRDLLIGTERNRISWYENVGSNEHRRLEYRGLVMLDDKPLELPVRPLTRGEPDIYTLDYYPVLEFVDWDADGDGDLLAGGFITGLIFLYENAGIDQGVPKLIARGPLKADGELLNVGHWNAAPCAADLDHDGDFDLLSGQMPLDAGMKAGIRYYENVGTRSAPDLRTSELKTDTLWNIALGTPRTFDWDDDGDLDFVISVRSHMLLLENAGDKSSPRFDREPRIVLPKWGPAPIVADQWLDWNGDGRLDAVYNFHVRLNGGATNPWDWPEHVALLKPGEKIEHPGIGDDEHSVLLDDFDGDGAIDLLYGDWFGHVWLHRNRGTTASPDFDLVGLKLQINDGTPIKVGPIGRDPGKDFDALQGARTVEAAGDFDGDGLRDLVVGDTYGKLRYFQQLPKTAALSQAPVFAEPVEFGDLGIRLNVCATDWNQDGRMDVIAGSANGKVRIFLATEAAGKKSPFDAEITPKLPPINQPRVLLGDLNGDGDDDLYFPSTQGACFVERSFLTHGYARGEVVKAGLE